MDKRHSLTPYSFRGRLMWALYVGAIISCVITFVFAYCVTHLNVQNEVTLQQQAIAMYLIEVDKRTDLALEDIRYFVQQSGFTITEIQPSSADMPEVAREGLQSRSIHTQLNDVADMPTTYVQTASRLLQIDSARGPGLYFVAFFRVITTALSYLAVVVLMVTLISFRLSKPVHQITLATGRVQEGDFDVRLPTNNPGEMGDLMRSFNAMTESLGQTAYLQKDFISSISHEFKTPIASIRGFAQLLQMPGLTPDQQQEYISLIAQESDRLSRLSQTLLRLTALEQQTGPATISRFSVTEQIRQVILRLEPTWSSRQLSWQLELDDDIFIESDEALLSHVWINLIQNAMKFSPEGSSIMVSASQQNGSVTVAITDHGCGMDEETLKRIFDRFFQADSSRKQEGVGLGLCLVRRILDMLGGHVKVTSVLGEGSTFAVTLPASVPEKKTEGQLHE